VLLETPFHGRTAPLNENHEWRDWGGQLAAVQYGPSLEREYWAIRDTAALIDITPLKKYEVVGPEAVELVDRIVTRDVRRLRPGRVLYTPWCDESGHVVDDGTVARLADDRLRVTAAEPSLRWFQDCGQGFDAEVRDVSDELCALALQGPSSRAVLADAIADLDVGRMRYFDHARASIAGAAIEVTRTGYTGDLGYELWLAPADAELVWDTLWEAGRERGLLVAGLAALDVARIEAGLLLNGVDYIPAQAALSADQPSSPLELGLEWTVAAAKRPFVGREALVAERTAGPRFCMVGLEVPWPELEKMWQRVDLAPHVGGRAARGRVPVYAGGEIGHATSITFSPVTKRFIALAQVRATHSLIGQPVRLELTVEGNRRRARAHVVQAPFFAPERRRA